MDGFLSALAVPKLMVNPYPPVSHHFWLWRSQQNFLPSSCAPEAPTTSQALCWTPRVLSLSPSVPPGGRLCHRPNFLEKQETESKDCSRGWISHDSDCQLQVPHWEFPGAPSSADGLNLGKMRGRSQTTANWTGVPGV